MNLKLTNKIKSVIIGKYFKEKIFFIKMSFFRGIPIYVIKLGKLKVET